ncbi:hypothetical protein [Microbulbifer sp. TYP-18]|uniref:hypothetical protein n=1 Tax=Microbulbifer sp. TYP-18 TaxID=3230024 RepID=UPI0034C5D6E0
MPESECVTQPAKVSIEAIALVEQRYLCFIQAVQDIRLALCALNLDAPDEAQVALLHLIDERLVWLESEGKAELSSLQDRLGA